jgi:hypothetical protein
MGQPWAAVSNGGLWRGVVDSIACASTAALESMVETDPVTRFMGKSWTKVVRG